MESQQLNLFSNLELSSPTDRTEKMVMSVEALQKWKNQILNYQNSLESIQPAQQASLFEIAPIHCESDSIEPFKLKLYPSLFYRLPEQGDRTCLYFIIDNTLPLLLYIGETKRSPKQRWINHDCQQYILQYIQLHRQYELDVQIATAFWWDTPTERKARQQLEKQLILKWRSPFNKENWDIWAQPFGKYS